MEKNYNKLIIQQLLLIERNDINSSKILLSSYIRNELISMNKNNNLPLKYKSFCLHWKKLKKIIPKYTIEDKKHLIDYREVVYKLDKICEGKTLRSGHKPQIK